MMEGISSDLQTKYQKLAAEYSKIRAQATVLKKAVIEEQTKNAELKDLQKEKEQLLRKADQEIESLNFRNQQLTKRVSVLQEELEIIQNKNKKGKSRGNGETSSELVSSVIDEELQNKIAQNAQLMSMMQEKEDEHSQLTQHLMDRVQSLEREVQQFQRTTSDVEAKYKVKLDELKCEKVRLSELVSRRERDVQQYTVQVAALQLQQEQLQADLGSKLQTASRIINTRLPFVDSKKHELNELNVPAHNRQQQAWSLHIIGEIGSHICDLTSQLSDFHTYTEQRLHAITDVLSPVGIKFSAHLKENARYLRAVEQGYKEFQAGLDSGVIITLETIPSLQYLADKVDKYNSYLQKLLPYQLLSLEEENLLSTCTDSLKDKNQEFHDHMSIFANCFTKLNIYVGLLAVQSKRTKQHPQVCQIRFLEELLLALKNLHSSVNELSTVFKDKCKLEKAMLTSTERLRSTNECLVNSLAAMSSTTKELCSILSDNKSKLLRLREVRSAIEHKPIKTHPAVAEFKQRASTYLQTIGQEEPPSVPYEEALRVREEAQGGPKSREVLGKQLQTVQQKATQLEQDKEHWRLEFQLLQMKHSKEQLRTRELEEQLQLSRSSATTPQSEDSADVKVTERSAEPSEHTTSPAPSLGQPDPPGSASPSKVAGMLGQVLCPFQTSAEVEAREQEVKQYFSERINQLVAERQLSDGKASSLHDECIALHERLQLASEQKTQLEESQRNAETTLAKLQEELQTTTSNYESQLSMMSEHLANMNEKLAVQKDEIDQLKYQLNIKAPKKGKQK